jgi:6-pyruvoyltetrahydropterin/6-carboxytetrahydropterin synthase
MRLTICKTFTFDAAHYLPNVADDHKCKRLHGHTYRVDVVCEGEPDHRGMICDFSEIAAAWEPVALLVDHRLLNEVDGLENPTAETLADVFVQTLHTALSCVVAVRVWESSTTWCEARA